MSNTDTAGTPAHPPHGLFAIAADGLDRAALERLHALGDFLVGRRLLLDVRVTALVAAREKRRRRLAAQITVDALLVGVKPASHVCFPFVCFVSHK